MLSKSTANGSAITTGGSLPSPVNNGTDGAIDTRSLSPTRTKPRSIANDGRVGDMNLVKLTLRTGNNVWICPDAVSHVGPYMLDSGQGASTCTGVTMTNGLTVPVHEGIGIVIALLLGGGHDQAI